MPPKRTTTPRGGRGRGRGRGRGGATTRAAANRSFPVEPPPEEPSSENTPLVTQPLTTLKPEELTPVPIESKPEKLSGKSKTLESVSGDDVVNREVVTRVVEELGGGMTEDGRRVVRRRVVKVVKKIVKKKRVRELGGLEGLSSGSGKNESVAKNDKDEILEGVEADERETVGKLGDGKSIVEDNKVEKDGILEHVEANEREENGKLGGDAFNEEDGITRDGKVDIPLGGNGCEVELKDVDCHRDDRVVMEGADIGLSRDHESEGVLKIQGDMGCHGDDKGSSDDRLVMEGADIGLSEDRESEGVLKREGEKGNPKVVFSGEMEALARKKKRKTEVFIGGLDKGAVEEDVRKVLEVVGEIVEVTVLKNESTGKNKGYAFVRFASADDASKAVEKHRKVQICGKECHVAAVQGNDTLHLGNIDRQWKTEDVTKLLHQIGVDKIDKVTVLPDPSNNQRNRGFAFLELQTCKDAQIAYKILQRKDILGKLKNIRVAWAEPLSEPNEGEIQKVKSVYVEYIPSTWDEGKLRAHFGKFGEIESVALAKSLYSSRRKDFAFINFTTRDAAIACIDTLNHEAPSDQGSKVNLKVSLARPIDRKKPKRGASNLVSKDAYKEKPKAAQGVPSVRTKGISVSTHNSHGQSRSSTNTELVHLLREQASWGQPPGRLSTGYPTSEYPLSIPGKKRPFAAVAEGLIYSDPREHSHLYLDNSFPGASSRPLLHDPRGTSAPYHLLQGAKYMSGVAYAGQAETSGVKREDLYGGRAGPHYRRHW